MSRQLCRANSLSFALSRGSSPGLGGDVDPEGVSMRKTTIPLIAFALLSAAGCEDGPEQIFQPAPEGAGKRWNNGGTAPVTDALKGDFATQYGGTSKQEICSGAEKAKRWAEMVNQ